MSLPISIKRTIVELRAAADALEELVHERKSVQSARPRLSREARERIAEAQRKRWAKVRRMAKRAA